MSNKLVVLTLFLLSFTLFVVGSFASHFCDQLKQEDKTIKHEVRELKIRLKKFDERVNHQLDDLYKKLGELNQVIRQQAKP